MASSPDSPTGKATDDTSPSPVRREHPRDPLHGITLETIVQTLVRQHGWKEMGRRIPIRCFLFNPTVKSSLTFLRKTPWARAKVEDWFLMDRQRDSSRL
ncbi:MAG TPA: VF530 family protein [Candidatus Paceibacterota bacterium]|nr:VF530 family protein [Candidatus Paceibacterota bacterium]